MDQRDIDYYRSRAATARAMAERAVDAGVRLTHFRMAERYEALVNGEAQIGATIVR